MVSSAHLWCSTVALATLSCRSSSSSSSSSLCLSGGSRRKKKLSNQMRSWPTATKSLHLLVNGKPQARLAGHVTPFGGGQRARGLVRRGDVNQRFALGRNQWLVRVNVSSSVASVKEIFRKDYKPADFAVDHMHLSFSLNATSTITSTFDLR